MPYAKDETYLCYTGCIKMIGAVLKLIMFTSMVNRIINTSRNERVTQQVYDTYLQMFDVCTLRHTAHIEAIVQFHTKRFLLRSRHYRFVPSQTEREEGSGIAHAHKTWTPTVSCLFLTISQHVSGIIMPIFRRTRRMLLHVLCCAVTSGES